MAEARRSTELRQVELADAALHIIATRGISELTTRSLAEQVGLTSGAIFRHFASLEAVLDAVVGRVEAVLEATYPPPELLPRERLERFIEARTVAVGSQVGILRLMLSDQFLLALPEGGSARLAACRQKTREFIRAAVHEGQEAGELRSDLDASTLATVVMGTMQMLALATATARQHRDEARTVREGLLTLLRPPPTKAARSKGNKRKST